MVSEKLIQLIWADGLFQQHHLRTVQGHLLSIVHRGSFNRDQGPDFLVACVELDGVRVVGNVEIHGDASDWYKHAHESDPYYANVILHVVWKIQEPIPDIPTLWLKPFVSEEVIVAYQKLINRPAKIPCSALLNKVDSAQWRQWQESLMMERLAIRSKNIAALLEQAKGSWEELCWWYLANSFGRPVNTQPFDQLAKSVLYKWIQQIRDHPVAVEALLFGQAGFLEGRFDDDYPIVLQKEYYFLRKKWNLSPIHTRWNHLRMRPPSFPMVRLAQMAAFLKAHSRIFSVLKSVDNLEEIIDLFRAEAHEYWKDHLHFDQTSAVGYRVMGIVPAQMLVLNGVIPLLFCYGTINHQQVLVKRALSWLFSLPPEENKFTKWWKAHGVKPIHAASSQALLQLTTCYCAQQKCLDCNIGKWVLTEAHQHWVGNISILKQSASDAGIDQTGYGSTN